MNRWHPIVVVIVLSMVIHLELSWNRRIGARIEDRQKIIMKSIDEKTSDRWTRADHERYVRELRQLIPATQRSEP